MLLEGTVLFQQANLEFKATTLNRMPSCETSKLFALSLPHLVVIWSFSLMSRVNLRSSFNCRF